VRRKWAKNRSARPDEAPKPRSPGSLIEHPRTAEPLGEEFPEIEDFPPEEITIFDDYEDVDGETSSSTRAKDG
jgi:hypothetical protein